MRADSLRALAARYRSLAVVYPGQGHEKSAEEAERMALALELELEWATEDAKREEKVK